MARFRVSKGADMASARITQRWTDGTEFEVDIHVDTGFPDAINEVSVQALKLWRDVMADAEADE